MSKVNDILLKHNRITQKQYELLEDEKQDNNKMTEDFMAIYQGVKVGTLSTNSKIGAEFSKAVTKQDVREAKKVVREELRAIEKDKIKAEKALKKEV